MAAAIGPAQGEEPRLGARMLRVGREHDRAIEQNLLGLGLPDLVVPPILVGIARVPLEPLETGEELVKDTHGECI